MLEWLRHPAALLFKRMLMGQIVSSQLAAGAELTQYPDDDHVQFKAVGVARVGHRFLAAHEILETAVQEVADGATPTVPFETVTLIT